MASQSIRRLTKDVETARKRLIVSLLAVVIVFILFEALRGADFWNKVKGEGNLWNYGSSLQYFAAGEAALINALLLSYYARVVRSRAGSHSPIPWALAGAGFVFFACDEMLEVHEKVGLMIERSIPWLRGLYFGHADDLIIVGYAVGALLFTVTVFRHSLITRPAKAYFLAGLVMVGLFSTLDFIPRKLYIGYLPLRETEELLELFAGFAFTASFISAAANTFSRTLIALESTAADAREPAPAGSSTHD